MMFSHNNYYENSHSQILIHKRFMHYNYDISSRLCDQPECQLNFDH